MSRRQRKAGNETRKSLTCKSLRRLGRLINFYVRVFAVLKTSLRQKTSRRHGKAGNETRNSLTSKSPRRLKDVSRDAFNTNKFAICQDFWRPEDVLYLETFFGKNTSRRQRKAWYWSTQDVLKMSNVPMPTGESFSEKKSFKHIYY